jgi:protein-disulfide isomerase-like protein with CxxC motif
MKILNPPKRSSARTARLLITGCFTLSAIAAPGDDVRPANALGPAGAPGDDRVLQRLAVSALRSVANGCGRRLLQPRAILVDRARELGLDLDQFQKDLDGTEVRERIRADQRHAQSVGVKTAPSVVINGYNVSELRVQRKWVSHRNKSRVG